MSLLTDADLEKLITDKPSTSSDENIIITPYDPKYLTPVGYDLRIGSPFATSDKVGRKELKEDQMMKLTRVQQH